MPVPLRSVRVGPLSDTMKNVVWCNFFAQFRVTRRVGCTENHPGNGCPYEAGKQTQWIPATKREGRYFAGGIASRHLLGSDRGQVQVWNPVTPVQLLRRES